MNQNVKSKWPKIYFAIVFLYFFIMRFLVIPSGDDFFWGGSQGKYLLQHGFYGPQAIYGGSSNGRYVGNFLEIFTIHHLLPAMLMYGIFWTLLIWCMWRLTGKTKLSLLLSSLFVFTFQDGYLSTVLAWNAGFINYVPPLSLILLYLVVVQKDWQGQLKNSNWLLTGAMFLMSLVGGLFVEHLTLYQIFIGLAVMIVGHFIFKKGIALYESGYLIGAVMSAAIMFSHPAYREHSTYRNTSLDIPALIHNYFNVTHFWFNTLNVVVNVVLCVTIVLLSSKMFKNSLRRWLTNIIASLFAVYYIAINLWLQTKTYDQFFMFKQLAGSKVALLDGGITVLFWIFLIYATLSFFRFKTDYVTYFSMFTYFALISPFLLIVSPINSREFFTAYIFLYLAMILFVRKALSFYAFKTRRSVKVILAAVLLLCAINVGVKMTMNYQANMARIQDERFLDSKTSLKTHVPFRKYVLSNDALLQQSGVYWKDYLTKTWWERM